MAKYKIGDKVRVKSDLISGDRYGYMYFTEDMKDACGTVLTIETVNPCSYGVKENYPSYWTDEMFEGLAEETPREFKVGDRVKLLLADWGSTKVGDLGTIIVVDSDSIGVEFDEACGGHDCGCGKDGHCWWVYREAVELIAEEPTPTPVVNVNVTVNLYENACWYCRKGGLVDLYLAGAMGICPSCGRVCNNIVPTKPKKESIVIEFKPKEPKKPKENKPLTKKELDALPNGAKVFSVWHDNWVVKGGKPNWNDPKTTWRTKRNGRFEWSGGFTDSNSKFALYYLEEPERPF